MLVIMGLFIMSYESTLTSTRKNPGQGYCIRLIFFLGASGLCNSTAIAVKGTLFCLYHWIIWNAENRDRVRIRIYGSSH